MRSYWVYLLTSRGNKVMYVGVTNDLVRRMWEHRHKQTPGFTAKYNVDRLVYVEETSCIDAAIAREKQIKSWRRAKKNAMVESANPQWADLAADWFE